MTPSPDSHCGSRAEWEVLTGGVLEEEEEREEEDALSLNANLPAICIPAQLP